MNVPNLKVILFMTDAFGVGWQEAHYSVDHFDPSVALSESKDVAIELAVKRAACLHALYYTLTDIRLSYDNVFRDSYLVDQGDIPTKTGTANTTKYNGGIGGSGGLYQSVQTAIPMLLSMRSFKKRAINYMSGFTDSVAQNIRGTSSNPAAYEVFKNYGRYLCNLAAPKDNSLGTSKWGTKLVLPEDPLNTVLPTLPVTKVSYIPIVGNKGTIIHINVAAGLDNHFAVGNTVYLNGFKIFTPQPKIRINGSYEIINTGMDTVPAQPFIEVVKKTMYVSPVTTALGTIQGSKAWVLPYQNYTFRQATHHKRGKPSFEPVGRR